MARILTALVRFDQIPQALRFFHGHGCLFPRADRRCPFERSPQTEHAHLEAHERRDTVMLIRMHVSLIGALGATLESKRGLARPQLGFESIKAQEKTLVRDK